MITLKMIDDGLYNEFIRIKEKSIIDHRPICQIGSYGFYFTTGNHDQYSMINYLINHERKEVIQDIYNALQAIFEDDNVSYEYSYYEHYLKEKLRYSKLKRRILL